MAIFNKDYLKEHMIYSNDEEELLDEQLIYTNEKAKDKDKYCIFSDAQSGRNFDKDPYIKVYDGPNQKDAKSVARISMRTGAPLPTDHSNTRKDAGKKRLRFTKSVAKFLTDAMMEKPNLNVNHYPKYITTVYDAIYYDIEEVVEDKSTVIRYPIPNFMENIE